MRFNFRLAVMLLACCSLRPAFAEDAPVMAISEEIGCDPKNVNAVIVPVPHQGRIAFKINRTRAQADSLTVSSKLPALAQQVY